MARDDYWNRGRREGVYQGTSAMDTLERVLGIGSNIAGRVQANRDKREAYNLNYIGALTKGIESNFLNDGTGGINQIIDKLESYKQNRMQNASPETLELLDIAKMKAMGQREANSDFLINKQLMMNKQKSYQDFVSDMFIYDSPTATSEQKKEIRAKLGSEYVEDESAWKIAQEEKMRNMMHEYSNDYVNWYTRHSNRLTDGMVSSFGASQQYMLEALNAWKDDDKIDKTEFDFYYGGIVSGKAPQLNEFVKTRNLGDRNAINVGYDNLNAEKKNFGIIDSAIKNKEMSYGDMLKNLPSGFLPSISEAGMLGDKIDANAVMKLTEDQVAYLTDESAKNSYEKIEEINSNLMGLKQKDQIGKDNLYDSYRSGYPEETISGKDKHSEITKEKYISNLKSNYGNEWKNFYDEEGFGPLDTEDKDKTINNFVDVDVLVGKVSKDYEFSKDDVRKKGEEVNRLKYFTDTTKYGENFKLTYEEAEKMGLTKKQWKKLKYYGRGKGESGSATYLLNHMLGRAEGLKGDTSNMSGFKKEYNRNRFNQPVSKEDVYSLKSEFDKESKDYANILAEIEKMDKLSHTWTEWESGGQRGFPPHIRTKEGEVYKELNRKKREFQKKWGTRSPDLSKGHFQTSSAGQLHDALKYYDEFLLKIISEEKDTLDDIMKDVS